MRQIMILFISILLLSTMASGQTKFSEFKVGFLSPSGAKTGFYGGLQMGRAVDENIGVGFAIDVYRRSYTKETKISEADIGEGNFEDIQTELEQSTTMLPLFFQIAYQGAMAPVINLRVAAGLGYAFLWNSVINYNTGKDKSQFFGGFAWHVDVGAVYALSRASDIFAEIYYHGGKPSRDEGKTEDGLPLRTEINMNGVGLRIGIRIYNLGF